jgi:Peptidase family M23
MKRVLALLPVLIAFQVGAPPALAWTWPVDGPVLRPFALGDDPYAGGQHRGVDVAGPADANVRSPVAGLVSFAGTVPGGGRTVTVQTADGYSVTLVHLGSIDVARNALLKEGTTLGTVGPTGDAEHAEPYVHLGVRITSDPHGYLDPLSLLPPREHAPPPAAAPAAPAPAAPPEVVVPQTPAQVPEAPAPALEAPAAAAAAAPEPEPASREAPAEVVSREVSAASAGVPRREARRRVPERDEAGSAETSEAGASVVVPARELQRSFELSAAPRLPAEAAPVSAASSSPGSSKRILVVALLGLAAGAMLLFLVALRLRGLRLGLRRLDVGQAGLAHAPSPVLDRRAGRAAEDAGASRPAEQDRVILDGDLESIALGEPEALPDLDRNDDPAELVEVTDDACRPRAVAPRRFHRVGPRPPSRCRGAKSDSARGPRNWLSSPRFPSARC